MSRWFRHYAGMVRDDKLVGVALRARQSVERVIWVYGAILESAAELNDGGRFEFDTAEAAYFLRADEADLNAIITALTNAGRLVESHVAKWSARQFPSDSSAPRVKRYRERMKAEAVATARTASNTDCNVTRPLPSRHRDAPETEAETEIDTNSPSLRSGEISASAPPPPQEPKKARQKKGTDISPDAQPTSADHGYATSQGMSAETIAHEWRKFVDWHLREGKESRNWAASWRSWCGRWATDYRGRQVGDQRPRAGPGAHVRPDKPTRFDVYAQYAADVSP